MESLYKLKSMDEKFRRVIVTHDLTKKVRKECKQLVGEAKAKTSADASGERTYQVRGPPGKMENEKLWETLTLGLGLGLCPCPTHDLTKKVRKECKQLVGEAKAKTSADASGERTYQVRGPPGKMENEKLLFNNMLNVHETMDIQNIKWHLTFLHLCYWLFL